MIPTDRIGRIGFRRIGIRSLALLAAAGALATFGAGCDTGVQAPDGGGPDLSYDIPDGGGAIPCDVEAVLADRCSGCHGTTPTNAAPQALVTWADLRHPSAVDPTMTYAQRALIRMQDAKNPMPPISPVGPVSAAGIAAFDTWIKGGQAIGDCAPYDPFAGASVCTTNATWDYGDSGATGMHPGVACINCHMDRPRAPQLLIGGTVYSTGHEPDDCAGGLPANNGATVVITGADKKVQTIKVLMTSNTKLVPPSGNFYLETFGHSLALPYTAKVVFNGKERAMNTAQMSGDCNSCHTELGDMNAPGRIVLP